MKCIGCFHCGLEISAALQGAITEFVSVAVHELLLAEVADLVL